MIGFFFFFSVKQGKKYFYVENEDKTFLYRVPKKSLIRKYNNVNDTKMSNNRVDRFKEIPAAQELVKTKRITASVEAEVELYDFVSIKYFNGVAQIIQFKVDGVKDKSIAEKYWIEDKAVSMLLDYYVLNEENILIPANLESINDADFVGLCEYKAHIPVISNNGVLKVVGDTSKFINSSTNLVFGPRFNSKKKKAKEEDVDYVPVNEKKNNQTFKKYTKNQTTTRKKKNTKEDFSDDEDDQEWSMLNKVFKNIKSTRRGSI